MVSCPGNTARSLSPRPALTGSLRGIAKNSSANGVKAKKETRETPTLRRATPIKDRSAALRAGFGRHRMQGELDALADEMLTCQLASALKGAGAGTGAGAPMGAAAGSSVPQGAVALPLAFEPLLQALRDE